jgi:transcriptional regulator with XRE-family HTH domain
MTENSEPITGINPIDVFSKRLDIMMTAMNVSTNELERRTGLKRNTIAHARSGKTFVRSDTIVTLVNGRGLSMAQVYGAADVKLSIEGQKFVALIENEPTEKGRKKMLAYHPAS